MTFSKEGISLACEDTSCSVVMQCWKFDTEEVFKKYMGSRVKNRLLDAEGTAEFVSHYDSIATTGFAENGLKDVFIRDLPKQDWRIGEALAECLLEDTGDIRFPWNGCRDQKVEDASLPGADLVGFKGKDRNVRFLFGEVKTSVDANKPPNVMYGRSGMTKQLEKLKTSESSRKLLVQWLGYRAKDKAWDNDYKTAVLAYVSCVDKVYLQGVLIRDCSPVIKDLESRGHSLDSGKPSDMGIGLCGIYCLCSISDFPALLGGVSLS
ncbi:MAG TPA: hypothetical protein VF399_03480 [bacterium]